MVANVARTLKKRGMHYGNFVQCAEIAQQLKNIRQDNDCHLNCVQREALDMIMTKIARIIAGDPNHKDSWHDIAGYAQLVEETLK